MQSRSETEAKHLNSCSSARKYMSSDASLHFVSLCMTVGEAALHDGWEAVLHDGCAAQPVMQSRSETEAKHLNSCGSAKKYMSSDASLHFVSLCMTLGGAALHDAWEAALHDAWEAALHDAWEAALHDAWGSSSA
jgi:hypothetical protein